VSRQQDIPVQMSAGIILVNPAGQVLLELRANDPTIMYPGYWGITGGGGLPGETPEATAIREVEEETGWRVPSMTFFRVYHFPGTPPGPRYEVHIFHAPAPSGDPHPGEGAALHFFTPEELTGLDLAYNHAEVLADFVASPDYQAHLNAGGATTNISPSDAYSAADPEAVEHLKQALSEGHHWFLALLEAIALWRPADEQVGERHYRYLIEGEAFDWLLLAERLLECIDGCVPPGEREALIFFGEAPLQVDEGCFRELIGEAKHRAHLNYLYGVTVEEALQLAVEEEVLKERRTRVWGGREPLDEVVFQRIYGRGREDLLAEFWSQRGLAGGDCISYQDLKNFTYWLFRHRLHQCDPARVASDTRKALAQLSRLELAARPERRARRRRRATPPAGEAGRVIDVG
jgi:8-oxo-dGTP pyrophosphatase MutT (NUDIX family)